MKQLRHALVGGLILLGGAVLWADASDPAVRFLAVEGSVWSTARQPAESLARAALPDGLVTLLDGHDGGFRGGWPEMVSVFRRDLNGDKLPEYFVQTNNGGSGGRHYLVCGAVDGEWRVLASRLGTLHETGRREEWGGLVAVSRGGGGHYAKTWLAFRDGSYAVEWIDRYDDGVITRERP